MTLRHFSSSDFIISANCSGVLDTGSTPCVAKRSRISALCSALAVSVLSRSTIYRGVPAGASSPCHVVTA